MKHEPLHGAMEPGGIEPPSRSSQQVASTRVVVPLISANRTANDCVPNRLNRTKFSLGVGLSATPGQPDVVGLTPYRASGAGRRGYLRREGKLMVAN